MQYIMCSWCIDIQSDAVFGDVWNLWVLHCVVNWLVATFQKNYLLPTSGHFPLKCWNKPIIMDGVKAQKFYTGVTSFLNCLVCM